MKIDEGIKSIGFCAFKKAGINSIQFPSSLEEIDSYVFFDCKELKDVKINEGLEYIGFSAFQNTGIVRITIPNSLLNIQENAFGDCKYLKEVIIGSKSSIVKFSEDKLKNIFGPYANIIIKDIQFKVDIELFNNIKKVNVEERNRLGLELFDEINKNEINLRKVQELLINGADTEIRDSDGNTGLMLMIKKGNNEVSMMYLLSGSDINAKNKLKETPLILSSRSNNNDIASQLIKRNCIVNAMTVLDESALSIAYDNGNLELVSRLESIMGISDKNSELDKIAKVRQKVLGGK